MVEPARRRIDWHVIVPHNPPHARLATPTAHASQLAALVASALAHPSPETADRALCHAVEFARNVIRLERSAIYLYDPENAAMVGTWGTGAAGETVDEHTLTYRYGGLDREILARAQAGFPWTAYEDCPLIAQVENETRILGKGWVACTAIVGAHGLLGILFNDTALSRSPLDEAKQSRAAVLCSLLGQVLERCRAQPAATPAPGPEPRIAQRVATLLAQDPSLSCHALAAKLHISPGRLTRTFKDEAHTSIVDYRNELRLARFLECVDAEAHNLLRAALDAGFGSYAQFHRVFRARFGLSPRVYLVERTPDGGNGSGK